MKNWAATPTPDPYWAVVELALSDLAERKVVSSDMNRMNIRRLHAAASASREKVDLPSRAEEFALIFGTATRSLREGKRSELADPANNSTAGLLYATLWLREAYGKSRTLPAFVNRS